MKKRCSKGKSCGATCISQKKVCISELPPEVRKDLLKARRKIKGKSKITEPTVAKKDKSPSDAQIKGAYERTWKLFEDIKARFKKHKESGEVAPEKLKKLKVLVMDRIRFLKQLYHAKDRARYLEITKEMNKLELESKRIKAKDSDKSFEISKQANRLRHERAAAYFGEPRNPSKFKSDKGGEVSPTVPSTLPRGGADKKLKEFLDGSELMRAFTVEGLTKVVENGSVKNGFQPGTGGVKLQANDKNEYLLARKKAESSVIGIPLDAPPAKRPIYGMLENPDRSISLQGGSMSQYGGVQVVFNSSLKNRSTFTVGDSMGDAWPLGMVASPVRNPAEPKVSGSISYGASSRNILMTNAMGTKGFPYVEAQIHGGVNLSDIKEVRVYKGHELPENVVSILRSKGINVVELPPRMMDLAFSPDIERIESLL